MTVCCIYGVIKDIISLLIKIMVHISGCDVIIVIDSRTGAVYRWTVANIAIHK